MKELISAKDRTVVIVSHDSKAINDLCDTVLWIHEGALMDFGPTAEIMPKYEEFMK